MNVLFRGECFKKDGFIEGYLHYDYDNNEDVALYIQKIDNRTFRESYEIIPETVEINLFGEWIKLTELENYKLVRCKSGNKRLKIR